MKRYLPVFVIVTMLASAILSACVAPTPQVIKEVETVVVEKEKVVEATVVVEKEKKVVETVVVEKEKKVVETVEVGTQAQENPFLSWDLEGGTVITDPAKMPKKFNEAPMLAALVKDGKLPPVEERLPKEPLVLQPLDAIGKYGGTIRMAVFNNNPETMNRPSSMDKLIFWDATGAKLVPSLAKSWEVSADGKTTTVYLREGLKWSDGQPFTTADIKFWWDDIYNNKEIYPTLSTDTETPGGQGALEVVDDYTLKFVFKDPYFMFPEVLAAPFTVVGSGRSLSIWLANYGPIVPAHYLKQFHPKYAAKADLDKLIADNKVQTWVELITAKNDWSLNPDAPVLGPWKTVQPMKTAAWILERNPYFWEVDTEGNQLPYIDQMFLTSVSSMETTNLKAVAGEFDFQYRDLTIANLPALLENGAKRGYKVYVDPVSNGCSFCLYFNQSYDADAEVAKWVTNVDFRRALSMAIDRDQFNEVFYLGLGRPGSQVVDESSPENPGPEYRTLWSTLDRAKANEMLDKIGLDKKDAEGYRLRTDNGKRLVIEITGSTDPPDQALKLEMLQQHWKEVGIELRLNILPYDEAAQYHRVENKSPMYNYTNWGTERLWGSPVEAGMNVTFTNVQADIGPAFGDWFATKGAKGREPTDPLIKKVAELYYQGFTVPLEERNKLGQEIWKIAIDQQWTVGVVGGFAFWPRLHNVDLGNTPDGVCFAAYCRFPATSRPETFFWNR